MALKEWTKRGEETLFRNPWWTYKRDRVTLPSGDAGEYHYVQTPGSVMLVPVTADGRFVLVRQYRYLNRRVSIEFPAGGIKPGQSAEEAAHAELREEAGFEADVLVEIGQFNPFNGVTDELCHVSVATGLHAVPAVPDATEEFEILLMDEGDIRGAIADGSLWDGMTLAAWSLYQSCKAHAHGSGSLPHGQTARNPAADAER
ncbi:MAG: NUDIX hydrolase [Bacteroidetes bacterium]|nr:NUDIX hydrolase [Bacteroidota bacterium]